MFGEGGGGVSVKITRKEMIKVAREEIRQWHGLPKGLALSILFAFVHRLTTGETIEETFFTNNSPDSDYQI